MAEIILFAERQIDGFANTQGYGVPSRGFNFGEDIEAFVLEPNAEYTVLWDEKAYKTIAQDVSAALGDGAYALGNAAAFDSSFSGNNEPFIIGWSTVGIVILVVDGSTETTHTVGIVQEIEQEEQPETQYGPNDAVILSYSQTPVVYEEIPKVWLTHPDSTEEAPKLVPFTYGEVVEGMEIDLNFSTGNDMTVTAPDGYLVKEAKILKPENLKPENISKDVEIAGVIGNLEGGDTEEVAVDLNMADGDQIVVPTETGKSMSKVTVKKPDTLIPGNIAAGVDIAGIIGSLVAGGGGGASDLKVKFGTFTTAAITSTGVRISADIGFKPGFLFIQANVAAVTNNKANVYFGIGSTFADAHGLTLFNNIVYRGTSAMTYYTYTYSINSSTASAPIYNASETGFNLGVRAPKASTEFFYIAIADPT